jgi:multidrug transporter EmrE-like cation transporter
MKFVFLYSALVANILTNIGFKLSALNDAIPVKKWGYLAGGLVFGLINSVLFTESLKYVNFGEASAVFFALTVIGLYGSSYFIFHEPVNAIGLVGVILITAGVIIISYSMSKVKGV